jgi:acetylornithine deacetylase/succinyl-diaminopimelate desuccinylase-like protein
LSAFNYVHSSVKVKNMNVSNISDFVENNSGRFLEELKELIRIPSISTLPEHAKDVRRAAEFLAENLRERVRLQNVEIIETDGHPLVYAEWLEAPGKPTVLIYGHYDVQPVDPLELWRTPPFEPTLEGENLRARGAVDDKGPMFANLKALETLMKVNGSLPVNVKVLIEGEEESGGASIAKYVAENGERLKADCALVLDTSMVEKGVPTISQALRGILYAEIVARGAAGDLHSGTYGGIAPNPFQALAWALAELKGRDGRINIPGLYELANPLSDAEREALKKQSEAQENALKAAAGLKELPGEEGFSIAERGSARPTFEVHGIIGGFTGAGAKTVIPAEAIAKISLRLVPGQNPDKVFELLSSRVKELAAPGTTLEVRLVHGGDAVLLPLDAPVLQTAARALEAEFNRPVAFQREGGSIPIVAQFSQQLNLPVVMYGFGLMDDNIHAPNEKFYLPNFYHAIRTVANFLMLLSNEK